MGTWTKLITLGIAALGATLMASACGVADEAADEDVESGAAELAPLQSCSPLRGPRCPARQACVFPVERACDPLSASGCSGACRDPAQDDPSRFSWVYVSRDVDRCRTTPFDCAQIGAPFFADDGCGCVFSASGFSPCGTTVCGPSERCCETLSCCVKRNQACTRSNCNAGLR